MTIDPKVSCVMPLLNRKVDYALVILSYLHHNPEGGCARAIAGRFGLSRAFVANILKSLCREGFVASHRGIKGGYVLQADTMTRSLAALMDALDDAHRVLQYAASANAWAPISDPVVQSIATAGGALYALLSTHQVIRYTGANSAWVPASNFTIQAIGAAGEPFIGTDRCIPGNALTGRRGVASIVQEAQERAEPLDACRRGAVT